MTAAAPNPYPGLRPFEPDEAEFFFGRECETDELRRRLRGTRFLAVIGASGSGKSSLVRCGLIPSLHAGFMSGAGSGWRVAIMRPGEDPIGHLAAALDHPEVFGAAAVHAETRRTVVEAGLRDSSRGLAEVVRQAALPPADKVLLVVDQFEELFRFHRSRRQGNSGSGIQPDAAGDDAQAFVKLLLQAAAAATPVYVVLTMRSEFIGDCMAFAGLPEAINAGQYLIPRISRDALRQAIGGPAAVAGAAIAPRLTARLLNEVGNDLDGLPVLQHALMRTWDLWAQDHRDGEPLDVRHFEAAGTMRHALSRHADEAFSALDAREQALAERLFKTLTETTEDGRGVRRPTAFGALQAVCGASAAELARVIDVFRAPGRAFLQPPASQLLTDETIVDLSHESLMRLWTRLVGWVQQQARSEEIYRRLLRSARQHAAGEASLWRPPELTLGLRWRAEQPAGAGRAADPNGYALATRFLDRSRNAHRLRVGLVTAVLVGAAVSAIGWFAHQAQQQRRENLALRAEVARLTQASAQAGAARAQALAQVQALRAANAALKAGVAELDGQRAPLAAAIVKLRDTNRGHDSKLAVLAAEHVLLAQRSEALDQEHDRLAQERTDLAASIAALSAVPPALSAQTQALGQQVDALSARRSQLQRLVWETQTCTPALAAAPSMSQELRPTAAAVMRRPAAAAAPAIPPDPADNDELRRRIETLARELAALLDERGRLQDESGWLQKENRLLAAQRTALELEVAELRHTQQALQQRQQALQAALAQAQAERRSLLDDLAAQTKRNDARRADVVAARQQHASLEEKVVGATQSMARLNADASRLLAQNRGFAGHLSSVVGTLLQAAANPQHATDLAAMLAVKAWRWAPYDSDDAAQPAIYNGLWLALRRVDAQAAAALLAPGDPAAGKLATTRSDVMVKALCARVGRPFSADEWQRHMPAGACFTPEAARPCPP